MRMPLRQGTLAESHCHAGHDIFDARRNRIYPDDIAVTHLTSQPVGVQRKLFHLMQGTLDNTLQCHFLPGSGGGQTSAAPADPARTHLFQFKIAGVDTADHGSQPTTGGSGSHPRQQARIATLVATQ